MKTIKSYLMIIVGNLLLAISVCAFTVPFDITVGGSTGVSIIFNKLFGIDMAIVILIVNIICLPLGFAYIGKKLLVGSLLSAFAYPFLLSICELIPGISTFSHNIMFSTIAGGIVSGIGVGLAIRGGGTIDGMEIISVVINKKTNMKVSHSMYIIDSFIMLGQLPFCSLDRVFYGLISAYILTFMINIVLNFRLNKEVSTDYIKEYES